MILILLSQRKDRTRRDPNRNLKLDVATLLLFAVRTPLRPFFFFFFFTVTEKRPDTTSK